jgi:predicted ATPase
VLLASQPPDLPPRHQTLLRAIDWSYDLLEPDEQALLRRLSIFVGGCSVEAAEAVTAGAADALELIASLVDKSLILQDEQADGEPRLRMLETIRAYAKAQLCASGEMEPTLARHAEYYVDRVERAAEALALAPDHLRLCARLEQERGNLLAVERRAVARSDANTIL